MPKLCHLLQLFKKEIRKIWIHSKKKKPKNKKQKTRTSLKNKYKKIFLLWVLFTKIEQSQYVEENQNRWKNVLRNDIPNF